MQDKHTDIVRIGIVSDVDAAACAAYVAFDDREDIVAGPLPIVVPFTLRDRAYYMPAVGERVLCLFDPQAVPNGFIIGSFYAMTRPTPDEDANVTCIEFEDATRIQYDKTAHRLDVDIPHDGLAVHLQTDGDVVVLAKDASVRANNASIDAQGSVSIAAQGIISIESGVAVNIAAPAINLN